MEDTFELLDIVDHFYENVFPIKDTILIASQHLLGTQLEMFKRLLTHNLKANEIYIIGKNYSTNEEVFETLKQTGVYVDPSSREFDPNNSFDNRFDSKIEELLKNVEKDNNLQNKNIVLLDDGGHLIQIAQEKGRNKKYQIVGVEQTSSGYNKVKNLGVDYFNIARSHTKLIYETPFIGDLCMERITQSIEANEIEKPKCLIVGAGPVGESTILRLTRLGIDCTGFDNKNYGQKILSYTTKRDVSDEHFLDFYKEYIKDFNVIIGATGGNILTFEQIKKLGPKVLLISISSSDREFPAVEIRRHSATNITNIHTDRKYENIILANSGFPITFKGNYHETPKNIIELTVALLYGAVLDQVFKYSNTNQYPTFNTLNARLVEEFKKRIHKDSF